MSTAVATRPRSKSRVPPLLDGDCLGQIEYMRRYEAMPQSIHAELLEGVVHMASPVSYVGHGKPQSDLLGSFWTYHVATPGVCSAAPSTVLLDLKNVPEPDGLLFIDPRVGGKVQITRKGYLKGAPELAAEISFSSLERDLRIKLPIYERSGINEYIIWNVEERMLLWHSLRAGRYERLAEDAAGVVRSETFPGLWLAARPLVEGNSQTVASVLQLGLHSPEHAKFVKKLQEKHS